MSASESATGTTNLHKSIEQLIAETIKQTQSTHEAETKALANALQSALGEIETSQQALLRAAEVLRKALGSDAPQAETAALVESIPLSDEGSAPTKTATPIELGPSSVPTDDRGPHEMDVIAHDASITHATGLQSWLRGRSEVKNAQTREFVNGELRLHLDMISGLDMTAFKSWLSEHGAKIGTSTETVIEIRFGGDA